MPTLRKDRENCWMGRVTINGKTVETRLFPGGRKQGPEWTECKKWEVERKKELLKAQEGPQTLTGCALLLAWGEQYLAHAEKSMSKSTFVEKRTVMRSFLAYCLEYGALDVAEFKRPMLYQYLSDIAEVHGAKRANVYRKNLLAAWNWGMDAVKGFPQGRFVLEGIKPFAVQENDRYVPPESDVIKVLEMASGQDLVMLMTYFYTGARRGEIFRLVWDDVCFDTQRIRLVDHKGRGGAKRVRWVPMHEELAKALAWWRDERPCVVDNVFMQLHCDGALGEPFQQRNKMMPRLCAKAGVKPFGFHAIRHKSASITFVGGGLNAAQSLMGHYRATTTDRYVRSAGLYGDQTVILAALSDSDISQAAAGLLKTAMPHEVATHGASCHQ